MRGARSRHPSFSGSRPHLTYISNACWTATKSQRNALHDAARARPPSSFSGSWRRCLLALFPLLGRSYFPVQIPDNLSLMSNARAATRIELSNQYIAQVENDIRQSYSRERSGMIVSNIGITPDLSSIYTSNSSMDTAFVQVSLKEDHKMAAMNTWSACGAAGERYARTDDLFSGRRPGRFSDQPGTAGANRYPGQWQQYGAGVCDCASKLRRRARGLKNVSDVYIPQDLRYPGLELKIDRERASLIGLSPKEVVDNVITAMTSNGMIAPSYWIDPKTGNNYMLTVQYFDRQIANMSWKISSRFRCGRPMSTSYTPLQSVADINEINTPTEVDHYQIRRVIDVYVMPSTEALADVSARASTESSKASKTKEYPHHSARRGRQHERVVHAFCHRADACRSHWFT